MLELLEPIQTTSVPVQSRHLPPRFTNSRPTVESCDVSLRRVLKYLRTTSANKTRVTKNRYQTARSVPYDSTSLMWAYPSSHIHWKVIKELATNLLRKKQDATTTASTWKACPKSSPYQKPGLAAAIEQFCPGTRAITDRTCNAGTARQRTCPPNWVCHPQCAFHVSHSTRTAFLKTKPVKIVRSPNPYVHLLTWDVPIVLLNDWLVAVQPSLPKWTTTLSTTIVDTYPAAFETPLPIATTRIERSLAVSA